MRYFCEPLYNVRYIRVTSIRCVGKVICSSGVIYDVRCVGTASSIHHIGKVCSSGVKLPAET
jgi:hypothetical protein